MDYFKLPPLFEINIKEIYFYGTKCGPDAVFPFLGPCTQYELSKVYHYLDGLFMNWKHVENKSVRVMVYKFE